MSFYFAFKNTSLVHFSLLFSGTFVIFYSVLKSIVHITENSTAPGRP